MYFDRRESCPGIMIRQTATERRHPLLALCTVARIARTLRPQQDPERIECRPPADTATTCLRACTRDLKHNGAGIVEREELCAGLVSARRLAERLATVRRLAGCA